MQSYMSLPHTYYFQRETVFINIIIIIPFYYSLPSAHYFCPSQDLPFLKQSVDTSPSSDIIVLMQLFPLSAWLPSFLFPSVQVLIGIFHPSKNVDLNVFIDLFIIQQNSVDSIFNVNKNICLRMRALPVSWLYLCALTKWMTQILLVGLKPAFSLTVFIESPPLTIKVNLEAQCKRSNFVSQSLVPESQGLGLTVAEAKEASGSCSFSKHLLRRWHPPVPPPQRPSLYSSPLLPHPTCSQEIFNK